jgi:GH18 family chitinase
MVSKSIITALALAGAVSASAHQGRSRNQGRHLDLVKKQEQENYGYMNVGYYVHSSSLSFEWYGYMLTSRPIGMPLPYTPAELTKRVIYQDYPVSSIPVDQYTHLLYSFANMSAEGTVYLSDPYAETQVRFPVFFLLNLLSLYNSVELIPMVDPL